MSGPTDIHHRSIIDTAARRHGIPPAVLYGIYGAETNFGRNVRTSSAGAVGPFQFEPGTAASLGINPHDFSQAADGAARYLASLLHGPAHGNLHRAIGMYNAGPGGNLANPETAAYIPTVLHLAEQWSGGGSANYAGTGVRPLSQGTPPKLSLGGTAVNYDQAIIDSLLGGHPGGLLKDIMSRVGTGAYTTNTPPSVTPGTPPKYKLGPAGGTAHGGTAVFDGKRVAGWIAPILQYARQRGWKGSLSSGYRSDAEQTAIYKSGVRPAAVPRSLGGNGSNHELTVFPGGAVDVSDAEGLSRILASSPYRGKLVWAGAKDPVHFSHPHGGSY